nr:retrovirus-related Pol polyprotein from transposon TNT 1-94 [Tanacetum cinerariifolium]
MAGLWFRMFRVNRIKVKGPIYRVEVQLDKMLLMQAQENGVALDEEQLLFLADDYDAFDFDVDEAPMTQTMFMANLSSADPVYDEVGPSYDSDILSEYVKDNAVPGVQSNVSSVPNDAYMIIYNDMYEPHAQSIPETSRNIIVDNSLTSELATYMEQVELYERRCQPALYNGYEILKDDHVPAIVHNTEDTLEIAEITRRKMNDKMKDPECVNHKVNITPHDYSKENFLATFTPQKQLTPNQMFWPQDLIKMKTEALKEHITASRPIKALTVKHDEIERKNLLIANDNLIAKCLSKEVFSVATNSKLNVARFTKMHVAHTIVEARCLELKAKLSNLRVLTLRKYDIDVEPIPSRLKNNKDAHLDYLRHLKESVKTIREIVEEAKVLSKFGNLRKLGKYGNPRAKYLPVLVINGDPQIVLWYLDSGCSKHMMGDRSWLINFIKKFIGTVRFRNDHFGAIIGYGDYVIGNSVISRVYYVEGLGHNLFSVRHFCDSDLEAAFRKHSFYVRDKDGVKLIKGSRGSNLYTISVEDMMKSSLFCLLSKASKNKSWLWHRCLNHLNFGTINDLARKDLVLGLPRLKFEKDHLYSACQLGKSKKHTHKLKTENTKLEVLNTLHMDICGPMRV